MQRKYTVIKGIVHFLTLYVLQEQAVNGQNSAVILPFWAYKKKQGEINNLKKLQAIFVKI